MDVDNRINMYIDATEELEPDSVEERTRKALLAPSLCGGNNTNVNERHVVKEQLIRSVKIISELCWRILCLQETLLNIITCLGLNTYWN